MKRLIKNERRAKDWRALLPWIFLALSLAATYSVWHTEYEAERAEMERAFHQQVNSTAIQLVNQLKLIEQALYSVRKLFDSSEFVSQEEFNRFVSEAKHSRFAFGVDDIGYAKYINFNQPETYNSLDSKLESIVKQLANQHQAVYAPVIYTVQQQASASPLPVFNAFTDAQLKARMEAAALHNDMLIAHNIGVDAQDTSDAVSVVLPVYKRGKQAKTKRGELISNVDGWVFFNVNLKAVFDHAVGVEVAPSVQYALYDDFQAPPSLLYQNVSADIGASDLSVQYPINEHGEKWILRANSLPVFDKRVDHQHSTIVAALGLLGSFALTGTLLLLLLRLRTMESLKHISQRLKMSDDRWKFAVESSGQGVWDLDIRKKKVSYSQSWKRMFGYEEDDPDDAVGVWREMVHPDDHAMVISTYRQALKTGGENEFECRVKCKNGEWKWVLARYMVVGKTPEGKPVRIVGTHTDLSKLKESEELAWQHANFDALTLLPNRHMLHSRLRQEIEKAQWKGTKVALLCLDLDGFSEVNDTFGLEVGDLLLREVARRLVSSIYRHEDVARYSGDEFAILIADISANELSHLDAVAQSVRGMMAAPFVIGDNEVYLSSSIGIAVYPDDASTFSDLVKSADQALYESSNQGGNCITYFTPEMQNKVNQRMQMTTDLRGALIRNEFFVEYQPIVEMNSGHVYKAEALLRWQHPEKGLISPAEFIPIAESTKLINEIGCWVLVESIEQCKVWRQKINTGFQISVNKSPVQFASGRDADYQCVDAMTASGLKNAIVIEITEGLLLDTTEYVRDALANYKEKGIQVALDDFGTGYSSLAYLQKFDIDYLKIDMSFVRHLETSAEDRLLCQTIITMAHGLGMQVIAEGVETVGQRDILLKAGCDYGQGYYFSKSLSPAQFEAYVKQAIDK